MRINIYREHTKTYYKSIFMILIIFIILSKPSMPEASEQATYTVPAGSTIQINISIPINVNEQDKKLTLVIASLQAELSPKENALITGAHIGYLTRDNIFHDLTSNATITIEAENSASKLYLITGNIRLDNNIKEIIFTVDVTGVQPGTAILRYNYTVTVSVEPPPTLREYSDYNNQVEITIEQGSTTTTQPTSTVSSETTEGKTEEVTYRVSTGNTKTANATIVGATIILPRNAGKHTMAWKEYGEVLLVVTVAALAIKLLLAAMRTR